MSERGPGRRVRTDIAANEGSVYTVTNFTRDTVFDAGSSSNAELGNALGGLIEDLIALGLIDGSVAA